MIIYEAKNKINNKRYIGQTTRTLKDRMRDHISASKRDRNVSFRFYDDLIKYGEENFEWNILEECVDKEDLDNLKQLKESCAKLDSDIKKVQRLEYTNSK